MSETSPPRIKRSVSHRDLSRKREFLLQCGSREELSRYLTDQIRRFTIIENKQDTVESVSHRNYVLSHTRSPSLQRKKHSQTSVDMTIAQLSNYTKIQPDARISELFEQLRTVLSPLCDNEQLLNLGMIGERLVHLDRKKKKKKKQKSKRKSSSTKEAEEVLLDQVIEDIEEVSEVERLLVSRGSLLRDAETIMTPFLTRWVEKESTETFLRENSDLRMVIRLFLKHLAMKKHNYVTAEGFLRAIPQFPVRLKEFLQRIQTLAEEKGLESADERGHKLVITVVHSHFIPQLPLELQSSAGRSLKHHMETNSEAFQKAVSIFTWS